MKAIVSRSNNLVDFPEVGMTNRTVTRSYRGDDRLLQYGVKPYLQVGQFARVEYFYEGPGALLKDPFKTEIWTKVEGNSLKRVK